MNARIAVAYRQDRGSLAVSYAINSLLEHAPLITDKILPEKIAVGTRGKRNRCRVCRTRKG